MTIGYAVLPDRQLVLVAWDGSVSWEQWREHVGRLLEDPAYRAARLQLTDMRSATLDETMNEEALHAMGDYVASQRAAITQKKIAIVPGAAWEQAKILEGLIASMGARPVVFTSLSTACTWLGVGANEAEAALGLLKARMRGETPR